MKTTTITLRCDDGSWIVLSSEPLRVALSVVHLGSDKKQINQVWRHFDRLDLQGRVEMTFTILGWLQVKLVRLVLDNQDFGIDFSATPHMAKLLDALEEIVADHTT